MHEFSKIYGNMNGVADWSRVADVQPCVPALLRLCQAEYPEQELSVFDNHRLTYGEANARSAILARQLLSDGVAKGTRIGMIFPNSPEFIITWLAIVRIGAVAVPISTLSAGPEIANIIRHADLHILITVDQYLNHNYLSRLEGELVGLKTARAPLMLEQAPFLRKIWVWGTRSVSWASNIDLAAPSIADDALLAAIELEVSPSDAVSIIYTSGSTAAPKGAIHTHNSFMRQAAKLAAIFPYQRDDRVFTSMPFFWVGGLTLTVLSSMHIGCTILGSGQTRSALLDFLERERVTYMIGWPHLMRTIENDPSFSGRHFSALRGGNLVGALPEAKRPKNQIFGHALGMTETGGPHTISAPDYPDDLAGTLGLPMPGMEHKLIDTETGREVSAGEAGALLIRGDALMAGFVKRDRAACFDADGWYPTGDLCSFRDGHLFFWGRTDDTIKSSGANVSPREVENALAALPGVAQAIVLGVPDEKRGGIVGAIIIPQPGAELSESEIRKSLAATLSIYKVPRVMRILDAKDIPTLSSTKIDRQKLINMLTKSQQPASFASSL